jgi:hypothetical protein
MMDDHLTLLFADDVRRQAATLLNALMPRCIAPHLPPPRPPRPETFDIVGSGARSHDLVYHPRPAWEGNVRLTVDGVRVDRLTVEVRQADGRWIEVWQHAITPEPERVSAGAKKDLVQYRVRVNCGALVSAAFFIWGDSEAQAVRRVKKVAPRADVVAVERIGRLVPVDDASRPSRMAGAGSGPVVPRFFDDGRTNVRTSP